LFGYLASIHQESSDFGLADIPSGPQLFELPKLQRTPPVRRVHHNEVASDFDKNAPQLTRIRKIDSMHIRDRVRNI